MKPKNHLREFSTSPEHHNAWIMSAKPALDRYCERSCMLRWNITYKLALVYHRRDDVSRATEHFPVKFIAL
jgi:hypothetical protein